MLPPALGTLEHLLTFWATELLEHEDGCGADRAVPMTQFLRDRPNANLVFLSDCIPRRAVTKFLQNLHVAVFIAH